MTFLSVIPGSCPVTVLFDARNREGDFDGRSRCGIAELDRTRIKTADAAVWRYAAELERVATLRQRTNGNRAIDADALARCAVDAQRIPVGIDIRARCDNRY